MTPVGLSRSDSRLLIAAGIIVVILTATTGLVTRSLPVEESPVPTTYSSSSNGAMGAYLLLKDLGYAAERWEDAPESFPGDPGTSLWIIAGPTEAPAAADRRALRDFAEAGGRVLFTGPQLDQFFPAPRPRPRRGIDWIRMRAALPSPYTRDAREIEMRPDAVWGTSEPVQNAPRSGGLRDEPELTKEERQAIALASAAQIRLYGDDSGAAVVAWKLGDGEILWWGGATPLSNAGISRPGNLRFFLNAMTGEQGRPLHIYWDEYFHGRHGSLWSYIAQSPVYWGMWQCGLLFVFALFAYSRRSGPLVTPRAVSRLSPLEFVDTMGGLYRRAGAGATAVEIHYQQARVNLARRLRMAVSSSDEQLARAAGERIGFDDAALRKTLATASAAAQAGTKLPERQALPIVQELLRIRDRLKQPGFSRAN